MGVMVVCIGGGGRISGGVGRGGGRRGSIRRLVMVMVMVMLLVCEAQQTRQVLPALFHAHSPRVCHTALHTHTNNKIKNFIY